MYAIVSIAGQQFKVEKGNKVFVHRLPGEIGETVSFDKVLLINRRLVAYGTSSEVFTAQNVHAGFGGQVLDLEGTIVIDHCCPDDQHNHQG